MVVGGVTGWSHTTIGLPTWASWTLAVPATVVGLVFAWSSTTSGRDGATNTLLKAYRRVGIEAAEKQYPLSRVSRERAGLQWFNVALALDRKGDDEAAEAVYRHAATCGFAPAMYNLANRLNRRGEEIEAQELYRRAAEAGFSQSDYT
jgi:TPR repeat protein